METIKTRIGEKFAIVKVNPWNPKTWWIITINTDFSETACGYQCCELRGISQRGDTTTWMFYKDDAEFYSTSDFVNFLKKNINFEEIMMH